MIDFNALTELDKMFHEFYKGQDLCLDYSPELIAETYHGLNNLTLVMPHVDAFTLVPPGNNTNDFVFGTSPSRNVTTPEAYVFRVYISQERALTFLNDKKKLNLYLSCFTVQSMSNIYRKIGTDIQVWAQRPAAANEYLRTLETRDDLEFRLYIKRKFND